MGGGGGGWYSPMSTSDIQHKLQESTEGLADAFADDLQEILNHLLPAINDRDTEEHNNLRNEIKETISDAIDHPLVSVNLGGSVSKSTYVEGISDVDSLAIFRDKEAAETRPSDLLESIAASLQDRFGNTCKVTTGKVAITIKQSTGDEFQVIPAVRDGGRLRVPSWDGQGWSKINIRTFTKALTGANQRLGGKLIPTIKLAKTVISQLPASKNLSGYHIESLAIEAFKGYTGPKNTASMLPHFIERASNLVTSPIRDRSGQSRNVDDYLGVKNSQKRKDVSHVLNRLHKRMINASASKSQEHWYKILGSSND